MVVGTLKVRFRMFDVASLKAKRSIVKSIINRTRNKFNVSIAETGTLDSHQWCEIGVCTVGNDSRKINSVLDIVLDFMENMDLAMLADSQIEIIHL